MKHGDLDVIQRGGKRKGAGRKPIGRGTSSKSILMTAKQWRIARELGSGNASQGIRYALDNWKKQEAK